MASLTRTTKHIIQTYRAVLGAEECTHAKLDALLKTNALYIVFEADQRHPYFELKAESKLTRTAFEALIAGVKLWDIDGQTVAEELDKVKAWQIVKELEADTELDRLRDLHPAAMTEADAAHSLLAVFHSASSVWSKSAATMVNSELAKLHGKRNVGRHKEAPELKITTECGAAVRELKKLTKELRNCGNGSSNILTELEKIQMMRVLSGQGKNAVIEMMLK
jgi:predicted RNase H-like nuclease (RuvC/YqgF family)